MSTTLNEQAQPDAAAEQLHLCLRKIDQAESARAYSSNGNLPSPDSEAEPSAADSSHPGGRG